MSVPFWARGVRTVTTFSRTWANPPSTKKRSTSLPRRVRSSPGPSRPISGARPGSTPSSPSYIGTMTESAEVSRMVRSGVTTTHCKLRLDGSIGFHLQSRERLLGLCHLLGLLGRFLDAADVHESVFRQVVPLAFAKFLEAANRLGQRRHLAGLVGECLGNDERLRQELLDAPGAMHDLLV